MGKFTTGMALLVALPGWGQTFELASIRQAEEGRRSGPFESIQVSPGSLTMRSVRFRTAVAWAYGVRDFQVTGPDWMDRLGFDIAAKSGDTAKEPELRAMLRALLAERSKGEVVVKRAPVSQLVELLAKVLRGPVVNETGLDGNYDATVNLMKYLPDGSSAPDIEALAVRAIQAEFGLKVEHRKTLMDFVIVDRAEKIPVEN
jgi:hypothetical protein